MKTKYILNFLIFVILIYFIGHAFEITNQFTDNNIITATVIIIVYAVILKTIDKILKNRGN